MLSSVRKKGFGSGRSMPLWMFHQLEELRTRAEHRVIEMREMGAPALREQWGEQAAAIGMTVEEILQSGKKRGRGNGKQNAEA
jgi:hypothetical protein